MASLEDQTEEMQKVAKQLNLKVVDVIAESQSAKKPGRPKFNQMLERIHSGEAHGILCWKLNRLARNPIDGGQISWLLQQGVIHHIQTQGRDYKPSDNVLLMAVELGMANQFVKELSVDVKRGMRQKAARGWCPQSHLPIGYKHRPEYKKLGGDEIVSTPDLLIMKKLFSDFLDGTYSIADMRRKAKMLGLRNENSKELAHNTFHNLFSNPMYMGKFYQRNEHGVKELLPGKHEAILTEAQFNRIQLLLGKRGRPTRINKYDFPFRGAGFTCGECGCSVTAEQKLQCICTSCKHKFSCKTTTACTKCGLEIEQMKNPTFVDKTYYRCTKKSKTIVCKQGGVEEQVFAESINAALKEIEIDKDFYLWAKAALKEIHKEEVAEHREAATRTHERKQELISRADNLAVMRADSEIGPDQFKKMKAEIDKELDEIDRESVLVSDQVKHWVEIADGYLCFAEKAHTVFNQTTDLRVKREILQTLGSNLTVLDKKAHISLIKPLQAIKNAKSATDIELQGLEPKKTLGKQESFQENDAAFSVLCAGLDSNQRRLSRRIYSPLHLTTLAPTHRYLFVSLMTSRSCIADWSAPFALLQRLYRLSPFSAKMLGNLLRKSPRLSHSNTDALLYLIRNCVTWRITYHIQRHPKRG